MNERAPFTTPSSKRPNENRHRSDLFPGALFVLLPLLCCGLPFLLGVLTLASAIARGVVVGVVVALGGGVAVLLVRQSSRRRGECCPPRTAPSPAEQGVTTK